MRHDQGGGGAEFDGEVAVGYGGERVAADFVKAQGGSDALAIDRVRRARQGGGAQRQAVDPLAAIGQAFRIAAEHFGIGQQMMAKGDRLRHLQVGEAGQYGASVFRSEEHTSELQSLMRSSYAVLCLKKNNTHAK